MKTRLTGRFPANRGSGRVVKGAAAVLVGAGVITGGIYWYQTHTASSLAGVVAAQTEALRVGDVDGAYRMTASAFRETVSRERFAAFLRDRDILVTYKPDQFKVSTLKSGRGEVTAHYALPNGTVEPVSFVLTKQDGIWRIRGIDGPRGVPTTTARPTIDERPEQRS